MNEKVLLSLISHASLLDIFLKTYQQVSRWLQFHKYAVDLSNAGLNIALSCGFETPGNLQVYLLPQLDSKRNLDYHLK